MPKLFSRRGRRPQLRSSQPAYLRPNPIEPLESRVLLSTSLLQRHNDNAGTGQDTTETVLNSTDVNSTDFGKQFPPPLTARFMPSLYMLPVSTSPPALIREFKTSSSSRLNTTASMPSMPAPASSSGKTASSAPPSSAAR